MTIVLLLAALAGDPAKAPEPEPARGRVLDMTQVDVVGRLEKPAITDVWGTPRVHRKNLIELRASFRPELARSPDKL